jgi:hypothetical protein
MEKIIHQIWVGRYKMPLKEQKFVQRVKDLHKDITHILWTEVDAEMPESMKYCYNKFYNTGDFAFCADLLRLWYVYKYGGFYLDVDWNMSGRLDDLFQYDGVFFYHREPDYTMPNGLFAAKKNSDILKYCIDAINDKNRWFGPSWFGGTIKKYLNLPYEISHSTVENLMESKKCKYYSYSKFQTDYGQHVALYSWSPENKKKFAENEQL